MRGKNLVRSFSLLFGVLYLFSSLASAQGFSGLARVEASQSAAKGTVEEVLIDLSLSQGVPYRMFLLDEPPRLVLDFQEVDWTGLREEEFLQGEGVLSARFGTYVPGWSRMVLELAGPMTVSAASMAIDSVTAAAELKVQLQDATQENFAENTGAPQDSHWDLPVPAPLKRPKQRDENAPLLVVLDPGHGGIDPGAKAEGGVVEKDLMLRFALELGEVLIRSGQFRVQVTRDDDYFVSLERRTALAHQAGADLFISLHADSIAQGHAHGSTVYILSDEASDAASSSLAERHDRGDLLAGTDLSQTDDLVAGVMLDLARQETRPRSKALARAVVSALQTHGGPVNRKPLRSAGFSVLKSADIPSILIEIGFMSSERDLKNLLDPAWRNQIARSILAGLIEWRILDEAQKDLVRQ